MNFGKNVQNLRKRYYSIFWIWLKTWAFVLIWSLLVKGHSSFFLLKLITYHFSSTAKFFQLFNEFLMKLYIQMNKGRVFHESFNKVYCGRFEKYGWPNMVRKLPSDHWETVLCQTRVLKVVREMKILKQKMIWKVMYQ